ncbi:MAG: hypothetical protein M1831_007354 [Alyxoria varia]|nr:MAG: hypothetical protein M1831_007354 [Alyxoria varia]
MGNTSDPALPAQGRRDALYQEALRKVERISTRSGAQLPPEALMSGNNMSRQMRELFGQTTGDFVTEEQSRQAATPTTSTAVDELSKLLRDDEGVRKAPDGADKQDSPASLVGSSEISSMKSLVHGTPQQKSSLFGMFRHTAGERG